MNPVLPCRGGPGFLIFGAGRVVVVHCSNMEGFGVEEGSPCGGRAAVHVDDSLPCQAGQRDVGLPSVGMPRKGGI
jgi:hypothetical protein